jgi:hypothetical protein
MTILKLIKYTGSAKNWGVQDVIDSIQKDFNRGEIAPNAKVLVISSNPQEDQKVVTSFTQCGMSAAEMIMMLEIAKQNIYRKYLDNEK